MIDLVKHAIISSVFLLQLQSGIWKPRVNFSSLKWLGAWIQADSSTGHPKKTGQRLKFMPVVRSKLHWADRWIWLQSVFFYSQRATISSLSFLWRRWTRARQVTLKDCRFDRGWICPHLSLDWASAATNVRVHAPTISSSPPNFHKIKRV